MLVIILDHIGQNHFITYNGGKRVLKADLLIAQSLKEIALMGIQWKKTNFLGVRYREHSTRKHGGNRPDKCFYIHYKVADKTKDEAVGWSSEGVIAESAFKILSQLRENNKLGTGPKTLAELRLANEKAAMQAQEERARQMFTQVTFSKFWESENFPHAQSTKKPGTIASEKWLFSKWIQPVIGDTALQELSVRDLDAIVNKAKKAKKSAATIRYILAIISQIWNMAVQLEAVSGDCPCRKIKKPRKDNRRIRFFTHEEAEQLLSELEIRSCDMHDIALLSL